MEYTNDKDQDNMLQDALVNIYRYWLEAEPKHTQELRKRCIIVDNIQGKIKDK